MDQKPVAVGNEQDWDEAQMEQALQRLNLLHVKVCPGYQMYQHARDSLLIRPL